MKDLLRSPNPATSSLDQFPWSVGEQWFVYDPAHVVDALLPHSYRYSAIAGKPWQSEIEHHSGDGKVEIEIDDRERVKHVLIIATALDDKGNNSDYKGVVADLTGVFTPGRLLPEPRTPRLDADMAEYICQLHNDRLMLGV